MDNRNISGGYGGHSDDGAEAPSARRVDVDRGPFNRILGALVALLVAAIACSVLGLGNVLAPRAPVAISRSPAGAAPGELAGTARPNTVLRVFDGDGPSAALLGETTADASGNWSMSLPPLAVGEHAIRVQQADGQGQPAQVTISVAAPAIAAVATSGPVVKPVVSAPAEGASLTIGRIPNVAGTAAPGTTVRVFDGESQIGLVVAGANGAWSLAQLPLAVGPHRLSARVLARDGAVLAQSDPVNVVVNPAATAAPTAQPTALATIAPPVAPTAVPAPAVLAAAVTPTVQIAPLAAASLLPGFSVPPYPGGAVFAPRPGELRGRAAPGSRIQLGIQEGATRTTTTEVTVGADGVWRVPLPRLATGPIAVQVSPLDAAGKALANSPALLTLTAVDGPVIANVFDGAQISPQSPGELRGIAAPNSKVRIYDGARLLGDVTADGNGTWVFKLPTLAPGPHALRASGVDVDGKDAPGGAPALRVSAVAAPLPPSFSPVFNNARLGTGGMSELFGRAEPGSRVRLFDGEGLVGETVADADGNWRLVVPPLATGAHSLTVRAVGADGKELASPPISVIVSVAGAPVASSGSATTGSATGVVTGAVASPGSATGVITGPVASSGSATTGSAAGVITGPVASSGSATTGSATGVVTGAATSPGSATTGLAPPGSSAAITTPKNGRLAAGSLVLGTAAPGATVVIFDGDTEVGRVKADVAGRWQFQLPADHPRGDRRISVASLGGDGAVGARSAPLQVMVTSPVLLPVTGAQTASATLAAVAALLLSAACGAGALWRRARRIPR